MRMVLAIAALFLIFGCLGDGEVQPVTNVTGEINETQEPPLTIIIGEQENQTIEQIIEEPEGPPPTEIPETTLELDYEYEPEGNIGVYFINASGPTLHGDAILVKKGDFDMLFDAGPQENANMVVDFLRSRDVDDIEILVSTNADPRHYGGIQVVADNFDIEHLWWSGGTFNNQEYAEVINRLKDEVKMVVEVEEGYSSELNGINFEVLNPPKNRFEDSNNDAIVTRIIEKNTSLLLTSGIQAGAHGNLASEQADKIKNQIIQAPYYGVGAGTSGIGRFLIAAEPEVMIISGSADDSPENGGSREPYMRLMEQYGIRWNSTYEIGTIRIASDGQEYSVQGLGNNLN